MAKVFFKTLEYNWVAFSYIQKFVRTDIMSVFVCCLFTLPATALCANDELILPSFHAR